MPLANGSSPNYFFFDKKHEFIARKYRIYIYILGNFLENLTGLNSDFSKSLKFVKNQQRKNGIAKNWDHNRAPRNFA